jgi:hypothetical protein
MTDENTYQQSKPDSELVNFAERVYDPLAEVEVGEKDYDESAETFGYIGNPEARPETFRRE